MGAVSLLRQPSALRPSSVRSPARSTPVATVHVGRNGDFSESVRVDSAEMGDEAKKMSYIRRRSASLLPSRLSQHQRTPLSASIGDTSATYQQNIRTSANYQHPISNRSAISSKQTGVSTCSKKQWNARPQLEMALMCQSGSVSNHLNEGRVRHEDYDHWPGLGKERVSGARS